MKVAVLLAVLLVALFVAAPDGAEAAPRKKVKVFVITMFEFPDTSPFGAETRRWIVNQGLTDKIEVPGLSPNFPFVHCRPGNPAHSDICVITTDIGYANAAASMAALIFGDQFDLDRTYWLVAGIAGVDPLDGTTGSAAWARWVVDLGLAHEIDAREMPEDWPYGYTGFGPVPPGVFPSRVIGTEVYRLPEALLQKAFALTQHLNLSVNDRPSTIAYRANYPNAPANQPPVVMKCDSASFDTYWHGPLLSLRANDWSKLWTNDDANYCMTNEEDSATLTVLKRAADADIIDWERVAVLRTASNFDQNYPGQTPWESLTTSSGGFLPSLDNAYLVGATLTNTILANWNGPNGWKQGVPA